jgi:DNA-binding winged helix-turn-helix (wHTH) protein
MRMRFADCVLDIAARQLERHGRIVPLEPKVYELLETLIKRRPAVVTNNELDELLWPQVYVARTSLTRLVSKLRVAVGDTPQGSRVIRTAYKTGYAFCADITSAPCAAESLAKIEVLWGRQCLPLTDGEHLAGRDPACALVVDAGTVSRCHARIRVVSGAATIEDLESTNGTHVNGARISGATPLNPGDELLLGSEPLQLRRHAISALTIKVADPKDVRDTLRKKSRRQRQHAGSLDPGAAD